MYNLTKLSEKSQLFVKSVRSDNFTSIAAAKAVANRLPLPSFEVEKALDHYLHVCYDQARIDVSNINEVVAINARETIELVRQFWLVRYNTVFPQKYQYVVQGNILASFLGFASTLPVETIQSLCENDGSAVRQLNGFVGLLADLTTEKTPEVSGDGLVTAGSGVAEAPDYVSEGFGGFALGFLGSGLGFFPGASTIIGGASKAAAEAKKKEVERIANEIQKIRSQGAQAALSAGKIDKEAFQTETKLETMDIVKGSILGTLPIIGGIYNGIQTSRLQDHSKELKEKLKELDKMLKDAGLQPPQEKAGA